MNATTNTDLHGFALRDGELCVGGIGLTQLTERVGCTPFYAYDRAILTRTTSALRAALPSQIRLHYSIKANPMPALVQHMAGLVDGFDVASAGELKTALDTPMAASHICFTGPGKRDPELRSAIAAGIVLHLESVGELERVAVIGNQLGMRPHVALRVNPDFELRQSGMRMSGGARPFGIDAEAMPSVMQHMRALDLEFVGLQLYCGSQSLHESAIIQAHDNIFKLTLQLADQAPAPITCLNLGGGFGIPYFPGEQPLPLTAISANLSQWVTRLESALPEARLVLELGRYLVGPAGVYVTRVVDRKMSRGQTFLVTDGGMHHHLAASGNLGQKIRRNFPVVIGNRAAAASTERASVVGPLCTPLDILADDIAVPPAHPGDLCVVFQSGAYGRSASPLGFLGHPEPVEVLV